MKEVLGIISNVKAGWKSTALGCVFIGIFIYQFFTEEKIELM